jgi:hypothetical protein
VRAPHRKRSAESAPQEPLDGALGHLGDEPHAALRAVGRWDLRDRACEARRPRRVLLDGDAARPLEGHDAARAEEPRLVRRQGTAAGIAWRSRPT